MIFIALIISILFVATLTKPSYGIMVYLVIRLCIPMSVRFMGFSLNTLALGVFIIVTLGRIVHMKNLASVQKRYVRTVLNYVLITILLAIISSITAVVPIDVQIKNILQYAFTELMPSVVLVLFLYDSTIEKSLYIDKTIYKVNYVILFCAFFSTSYAIYTFFSLSNPIYEILATSGVELDNINSDVSRGGMLEGTGVGILNNKISMSLTSLLFFTFFWGNKIIGRYSRILILILSAVSILLTSQRSAILCMLLFLTIELIRGNHMWKRFMFFATIVSFLYLAVFFFFNQFNQLSNVFVAVLFIWNDSLQSELGVGGSSMSMRYEQLLAVIDIVDVHILEGLGYGFHEYYYDVLKQGDSYMAGKLLGFESILFHQYSNSGFIGIVALLKLYYNTLRMQFSKDADSLYYVIFTGSYFLAAIMTDISGTSYLYFLFIALMLINTNCLLGSCKSQAV